MEIKKSDRIWCFAPWYNLLFYTAPNRTSLAPCCYWATDLMELKSMPETEEQVMRAYNSKKFIELRERLITGDVSGTPCERCYERLLNDVRWGTSSQMGKELPKLSFNSSDNFISLHARVNNDYQTGKTVLDNPPLSYYFFLSQRCNLHCIMCTQNHSDPFLAPVNSIIALLRSQGFHRIDQVGLIGGEPLFAKDGLELIHYLTNEELHGANVFITTNGTLLKRELKSLASIKNLKLTISLDGADKETYESIRRTSWENMLENFRALTRKDVYNPRWDVSINCCVMRSNICHLDKVVNLAHDLRFGLTFSAISGAPFESENILLYNYLLDDAPGWEVAFNNTLEKAKGFGMSNTATWLELLLRLLATPPKITREMMADFWDYGWKTNKEVAYFQLNKIYLAKLAVDRQPLNSRYIEGLLFPAKWKVTLLCKLRDWERPLARTFPILKRVERTALKIALRFV